MLCLIVLWGFSLVTSSSGVKGLLNLDFSTSQTLYTYIDADVTSKGMCCVIGCLFRVHIEFSFNRAGKRGKFVNSLSGVQSSE